MLIVTNCVLLSVVDIAENVALELKPRQPGSGFQVSVYESRGVRGKAAHKRKEAVITPTSAGGRRGKEAPLTSL